jgi:hypothetical protein
MIPPVSIELSVLAAFIGGVCFGAGLAQWLADRRARRAVGGA